MVCRYNVVFPTEAHYRLHVYVKVEIIQVYYSRASFLSFKANFLNFSPYNNDLNASWNNFKLFKILPELSAYN